MNRAACTDQRATLEKIFRAALAAVEPRRLVAEALAGRRAGAQAVPAIVAGARRVYLLAVGKASVAMAAEAEAVLGDRSREGVVIAPEAVTPSLSASRVPLYRAAHPIPDLSCERAGRAALELAARAGGGDLLLVLLSGGSSAMMVAPAARITLDDIVAVNAALLRAGAPIRELNLVRRHLSAIKGGGMLRAGQSRVLTLILSDVIGNDLATIGSGPTASDSSTFADAISVLKRRGLWGRTPEAVRDRFERGAAGEIAETVKPGDPVLARATNVVIGDNASAVEAAAEAAAGLGFALQRAPDMAGEADDVGHAMAERMCAVDRPGVCVVAGGEPVVTVRGSGQGGRAQQAALAMALALARIGSARRIMGLFAGTDGRDGPTDAAGAFVDASTAARGAALGLDAAAALRANDAWGFFNATGGLFRTGATGTNVADLFIGLASG